MHMGSSATTRYPTIGLLLLALLWSPAAGLTDKELRKLDVLRSAIETSLSQTSWKTKAVSTRMYEGPLTLGLGTEATIHFSVNQSIKPREGMNGKFDTYTKAATSVDDDITLSFFVEVSQQSAADDENPWVRVDVMGDSEVEAASEELELPNGWVRQSEVEKNEVVQDSILFPLQFNDPTFAFNVTAFDGSNNRIVEVTELDGEVLDGVETRVIAVKAFPNAVDLDTLANLPEVEITRRMLELSVAPTLMSVDILPERSMEPIEGKYWIHSEEKWLVRLETKTTVVSDVLPPQEGNLTWDFFDYNKNVTLLGPTSGGLNRVSFSIALLCVSLALSAAIFL